MPKIPQADADPRIPRDALDANTAVVVDEDILKDEHSRATGFIGRTSEVQWLRSIILRLDDLDKTSAKAMVQALVRPQERFGPSLSSLNPASSFTFYLDSEHIDLGFFVNPYELPSLHTARRLLDSYMKSVHHLFPILSRTLFEDQFEKYFMASETSNAMPADPKWQSVLNSVFAIGAKYLHLITSSWRADTDDHQIYHARARALGLDHPSCRSSRRIADPSHGVVGILQSFHGTGQPVGLIVTFTGVH